MQRFASASVIFLANPAQAWWNNGHMLTARIAQKELEANHPDVWAQVNTVLAQIQTEYEQDHVFVESATFPDKFKYKGFKELGKRSPVSTFGPWHYVDTPYFNGVPEQDIDQSDYNVVNAINQLVPELQKNGNTDLESYQLRCLIHYVGDIHQPLHAVTMYSEDFPKGDRGGNSFQLDQLNPKFKITELHALWDSVVTSFASDWQEPLDEDDWNTVSDAATDITGRYPRSTFDLQITDVQGWANESLAIAKSTVYADIVQYEWPSDDYIENGKVAAEKRIAQGGYRLADLITSIYQNGGFQVVE